MDIIAKIIGTGFLFIVALPLFVYFVVLGFAPKKTNRDKYLLALIGMLFMVWQLYIGYI